MRHELLSWVRLIALGVGVLGSSPPHLRYPRRWSIWSPFGGGGDRNAKTPGRAAVTDARLAGEKE
jgi:hypothetical protein